mgnify:CR=1 FL=1
MRTEGTNLFSATTIFVFAPTPEEEKCLELEFTGDTEGPDASHRVRSSTIRNCFYCWETVENLHTQIVANTSHVNPPGSLFGGVFSATCFCLLVQLQLTIVFRRTVNHVISNLAIGLYSCHFFYYFISNHNSWNNILLKIEYIGQNRRTSDVTLTFCISLFGLCTSFSLQIINKMVSKSKLLTFA